jgi:glycosyltransferase involved in cell wall biosynthesis
MRILLIDQYGELGGGQRCLLETAAGFAARGWTVNAAVPEQGPLKSALSPFCDRIFSIPCGPFSSTRKNAGDVLRFAAQLPVQAVSLARIAHRAGADVLYVNGPRVLPAAALARGSRPLVFHAHWNVIQPAGAALMRHGLEASDAYVIASSRSIARVLEGAVPSGRIRVVYNGVAGYGTTPRLRSTIRHIVVLGRIAPEKGQLGFVRAARVASEAAPELRFTVCGAPLFTGERYAASVRAEAAGLPVAFPGWTQTGAAWWADADLLVVPSDATDNIPRVIIEAFAAGVPVLAYPSGGIPELIEHRVTGLLVRERTPRALASAILSASLSVQHLNEIAIRAYYRWQGYYTLERFQSELCDALDDVAVSCGFAKRSMAASLSI